MSCKKTIIVVGGAHGGPSAVARARQANENARIILVEQAPFVTWVQASIRYYLSDDEERIKKALEEQERYFEKRYNVEVRTNTRAVALDLDARVLVVEVNKRHERMAFDSLVFAGGAISKTLDIAGLSGPRVMHFRNLIDVGLIKKAMNEGAKRAVVVGCGSYGVEAALALRAAGLHVVALEKKKRVMPHFSMTFAKAIVGKMRQQQIDVKLGTHILSATPCDAGFELELSHHEKIAADLVVCCIGISPRTALLAEAGAALDPEGLIRVDDFMATTLPNVYACGSAVSVPQAVTNERTWIPQPAIVLRTAHIAGYNAAIDKHETLDRLKPFCGTLISEVGDTCFARTGLQEHQARLLLGDEQVFSTTVFGSAAEAWVYEQEMCVKLLVDKSHNKIIGGEVFGRQGVERRIDLLAVAVLEGWSPDQIIDLDMAYLANSGPAFDPLKEAAWRVKLALSNGSTAVSVEQLALWLANNRDFRLVDVGETPLLSSRPHTKSLHVPLENLRERLDELTNVDTPIVLYSKSGHRSYLAQMALKQRGIANVYHLDGGIATWNLMGPKD
jgi:NADPH-dependent 2,4-dienoyl-CoA reductase/sulfur reductase-like enzyme/rhodanese-related sulfurtransferase